MTKWKYEFKGKIRNIQLISENDPEYIAYVERAKLSKLHLNSGNERTYSDLISFPLEITVREWVKSAFTASDNRIIRYELLSTKNKYERKYNELDFICLEERKYLLGEVKVSSKEKKMIQKASNQLSNAYHLLKLKDKDFDIEILVVYINLNYKNSEMPSDVFDPDFSRMNYRTSGSNKFMYNYLVLSPVEIFNWGVDNGFIKTPELLQKAMEEADTNHQRRMKRKELLDANIPVHEWPEDLKGEPKEKNKENRIISFGNTTSNPFAEKLKAALKKKK